MNIVTIFFDPAGYKNKYVVSTFWAIEGDFKLVEPRIVCDSIVDARVNVPFSMKLISHDSTNDKTITEIYI